MYRFKRLGLFILFKFQNWLFSLRILIRNTNGFNKLDNIGKLLTAKNCDVPLVRVGGNEDGSYLVPDVFETIDFCVSPGVGPSSSFEFELENKYQIPSLLIDSSVLAPVENLARAFHVKKFLSTYTDQHFIDIEEATLMAKEKFNSNKLGILQVDIEGSEYYSLLGKINFLGDNYKVIILELHYLDLVCLEFFAGLVDALLRELDVRYKLVYVNDNPCCGYVMNRGKKLSRVVELTYLNRYNA